jgi:autotransporter-associated beta strand protein
LSNSEVIPNGFGKGNVTMQGFGTGQIFWDMHGFSETINGLSTTGTGASCVISNGVATTTSTLTLGDNDQSGTFAGILKAGNGTLALTKIGAGVETLTAADTYTGATTISNGILQLTGSGSINNSSAVNINGGTFDVSSASSYTIPSTQTISLSGGTFFIQSAISGTTPVSFTNGTLKVLSVAVGQLSAGLTVPTLNIGGAANVIQIANLPAIPAYPQVFPMIKYTTLTGIPNVSGLAPTFSASLPPGGFPAFGGFISNDNVSAQIYLVLTNGPVTPQLTWYGASGGSPNSTWDLAVSDWTNKPAISFASYSDGSLVIFDDGSQTQVVNLTIDATPGSITFNNTNVNYTLVGTGGLHGASTNSFAKNGTGKVTLDNSGTNDSTAPVSISAGIVQVGKGDTGGGLGTGNIGNNGTIVFNRTDATLTVPNAISGTGGLLVSNVNAASTMTVLSGSSSFSGNVYVITNVTLAPANAGALSSTNGTVTIPSGATLEVGGLGLAANTVAVKKTVNVVGAGVDGTSGAILNSTTTNQQNALLRVTLAGDTTVGGSGRFDIRGTGASLSTGGSAYNLTKKGAGQFSIVGANVDSALNNVDVQGGTLSVETSTSGLGNPSANLTMHSGTTLQLFQLAAPLNKQIAMGSSISDSTTVNAGSGTGNTVVGTMPMNGFVTLNTASGAKLTLSNAISGTAAIFKTGTNGTVVIAGTDNHNSGTTVNDGTYVLNSINNNPGPANIITVGPSVSLPGTATLGGNGTNAATMDVEDVLWPGAGGKPGTLGIGDGQGDPYNGDGNSGLQFGYAGSTGKAIFSLNNDTTVGNGINDLIKINGDLQGGGARVWVNPLTPLSGGNTYTIVQYSGIRNGDFFTTVTNTATQPNRYAFTLSYSGSSPNNIVQLNVLAGAATLQWNNFQANGIWDLTNSFTWHNTVGNTNDYFAQQDSVIFDDSIGNAGTTVNLTTTNLPYSVTVNSASNYTFTGAGKIGGAVGITKMGTGTLLINNTNDYTGITLITNGILQVANASAVGSFTGGAVIVTNNGAFDVGGNTNNEGITFTNANGDIKPFIVSGWGYKSNGVIINSGPAHQQQAFVNITLAGDTAFGGPGIAQANGSAGRWDMRAGGTTPVLSTGGHAYNLYKVGTNQVSLVGVNVDTNLADIFINSGEFGVETTTSPTLGNSNNTIRVASGASFEFFSFAGPLNKNLLVNGGGVLSNTFNLWFNSGTTPIASPVIITNGQVAIGGAGNGVFSNTISGPGSLSFSGAGTVTLVAANTYTGNTILSNGTVTLNGPGSISTSPNITVLAGATLNAAPRVDNTLDLINGQTLIGDGTIGGSLSNAVGSTVSVGTNVNTISKLTVTTNAWLNGTVVMDVDAAGATNDVLSASGSVNYGSSGTLSLTITGTLSAGQSFKLFNGSTYTGAFGSISPSTPGAGLNWDTTSLTADGSLKVVSNGPGTFTQTPVMTAISFSGNNIVASVTNAQAGDGYYLLSTTNLNSPWKVVSTNIPASVGANGSFTFTGTNVVTSGGQQQFYILVNSNGATAIP